MSLSEQVCCCHAVVAVAQLVESRIVIPVVVGSSPIGHPSTAVNQNFRSLFSEFSGKFRHVSRDTPTLAVHWGGFLHFGVYSAELLFHFPHAVHSQLNVRTFWCALAGCHKAFVNLSRDNME